MNSKMRSMPPSMTENVAIAFTSSSNCFRAGWSFNNLSKLAFLRYPSVMIGGRANEDDEAAPFAGDAKAPSFTSPSSPLSRVAPTGKCLNTSKSFVLAGGGSSCRG